MTFFELVKAKKTKIRRASWAKRDYISLVDTGKGFSEFDYWDNEKFEWFRRKLTLVDFAAKDWQEEK